ncbi:FAE1/Type III polyketide synthase-like protein-domain-containing protein [Scenedesmus sp. NREL 46B-D3]|nr:FAE1/Type III polyketide synthase-like protein-domain-containing protein [Scenedesmus sp. NREL 46B-D3]
MAYFANYFKMRDLSDITMVIRLSPSEDQEQLQVSEDSAGPPLKRTRRKTDDAADANPRQLSSFPAHRLVLFSSDYFKAQGRHWQAQPNAAQNCKKGTAGEPTGSSSEATEHPCVHLTIDSAEQLPAAEAVIATMYGVPGATGTLEQQQLVHAVVLADMVGVEAASEQALQALTSAALSQQGLPAAALDALAGLAAWPASWNHSPGVLDPCVAQLRSLLSLRQAASQEQLPAAIAAFTTTSPASWRLGARQIRPLADGVRLEWRLPVEQLKQACRDSCAQQKAVYIYSPDSSPPMGGLVWLLHISCVQQGGGSIVGLFVGPRQLSEAIWYKCKFTVTWDRVSYSSRGTPTDGARGYVNFFGLAPMAAGGWDEAAWAAAALPTSGEMLLQLHVHSVGHSTGSRSPRQPAAHGKRARAAVQLHTAPHSAWQSKVQSSCQQQRQSQAAVFGVPGAISGPQQCQPLTLLLPLKPIAAADPLVAAIITECFCKLAAGSAPDQAAGWWWLAGVAATSGAAEAGLQGQLRTAVDRQAIVGYTGQPTSKGTMHWHKLRRGHQQGPAVGRCGDHVDDIRGFAPGLEASALWRAWQRRCIAMLQRLSATARCWSARRVLVYQPPQQQPGCIPFPADVVQVLCLFLVVLAFCAAHADKGLSSSGSLDLGLSKGKATAAAADGTAAAATSGVAVLSAPQVSVDLSIKKEKVPLLTVSEAPCKKICKDKCTITLEEHCLTVDVPKKHCAIEKKTISKQFCEKKCKPSLQLDLPDFKLPTLPKDAPANPNPSAPPAAANSSAPPAAAVNPSAPPATLQAAAQPQPKLHLSKSAALSAAGTEASASVGVDASADAVDVDADLSASKDGRRLQGLAKLPKADLDVECRDVCVTVPFVMPKLKCTETTEKVEKCTEVPKKECKEECTCLPQKSLALALPKKPALSVSVDASDGKLGVDAAASGSHRALKGVKSVSRKWQPKRWIKQATHKQQISRPHPRAAGQLAPCAQQEKADFVSKIFLASGISTTRTANPACLQPTLTAEPKPGLNNAKAECRIILQRLNAGPCSQDGVRPGHQRGAAQLLAATDNDILITNTSMYCPTPSIASMAINMFKMRKDVRAYHLGSRGCAFGVVGLNLVRDMLKAHPGKICLFVSSESLTSAFLPRPPQGSPGDQCAVPHGRHCQHPDQQPCLEVSQQVPAAALPAHAHCALNWEPDEEGINGIVITKMLSSEAANVLDKGLDYTRCADHFLLHTGGYAILRGILRLPAEHTLPSFASLRDSGNTSGASTWYPWSRIESTDGVRKGQTVLQPIHTSNKDLLLQVKRRYLGTPTVGAH